MANRHRGLIAVSAPALLALTLLGCGTPTGPDSFERLDEVPNRLDEPTTTTSTIVTTSTTTTMPSTPVSTDAPPDTNPTQIVEIFLLSRGDLRSVERPAPSPVNANDLISLLEEDPSTQLLETLVEENLIRDTSLERGVVTIDLDAEIYDGVPRRDQRALFAQIVLTFVSDRGLPGVGQATFTLDGEQLVVPTSAGQLTDDPVAFADYEGMLVDADDVPESTTTLPPETTTTTVPEATTTTTSEAPPATTAVPVEPVTTPG